MKVLGHPASTCTRKVLTVLAEKNAPYEFQVIDFGKGEHKQPPHLEHQPFGVVPVLQDGSFEMYESRAIVRYLNDKLPGTQLIPEKLEDRARMDQWISVEYSNFTPPAMKIIMQMIFAPWRGEKPNMEVVQAGRDAIKTSCDVLEKWLNGREYLAGNSFSLADISYMPYVEYLFAGESGDLVTSRPNFNAWWQRVSSRPSWKKVTAR
jgi:glutathione S-transferase